MKELTNGIRFSAWNDSGRKMCCISGNIEGSKLSYISFYFTHDEFREFANGRESFSDIAHNLRTYGEHCMFFDLPDFVSTHGVAQLPYIRLTIPYFIRNVLLRWAERRWKDDASRDYYKPREEILITPERASRWLKLYGQAKGNVRLDMDDLTRNFLEEKLSEPNSNLRENIDRLVSIARNSTYKFYQTGIVRLSKDWNGFFFNILTPRGLSSLNGGVINHGTKDEPRWSIHT